MVNTVDLSGKWLARVLGLDPQDINRFRKKVLHSVFAGNPPISLIKRFVHSIIFILKGLHRKVPYSSGPDVLVFIPGKPDKQCSELSLKNARITQLGSYELCTEDLIKLSFGSSLSLLVRLLYCMIGSMFLSQSDRKLLAACLTPFLVGKAIYQSTLKRKSVKYALFWGHSFDLSSFFGSINVTRHSSNKSIFFIASHFLEDRDYLVADQVILLHKWLLPFVKRNPELIHTSEIIMGKNDNYRLSPPYTEKKEKQNSLAVYMAGFHVCHVIGFDTEETINIGLKIENKLLNVIREYAEMRPDLNFTIFPHPGEKRINPSGFGEYYKDIVKSPNVSVFTPLKPAYESFDDYEVGIALTSSSILERLQKGHKGVYLFTNDFHNCFNNTALDQIIVKNAQEAVERIEAIRVMSRDKYFKMIDFEEVLVGERFKD